MQRDPRIYLQDVLDAARAIESFLLNVTELNFAENELVQSAVYYQFAIIGEALNNFSKTSAEQAEAIPDLKNIISFRNILTHAYHKVSSDLVYGYAKDRLPVLRSSTEMLIAKIS